MRKTCITQKLDIRDVNVDVIAQVNQVNLHSNFTAQNIIDRLVYSNL